MNNKIVLLIIPFLLVSFVSALDLGDYPSMFIDNNKFNGILVVADNAPANDVIGISDIAMSIQYQGTMTDAGVKVSKIEIGVTRLASEISNSNAQNLILVGRPKRDASNGNMLIDEFYSGSPSGGLIKLVKNGNYYVLIATGDTTQNTREATKFLANYKDYDLNGMEMDIGNIGEKPPCSDSDNGKNYYVNGKVTGGLGEFILDSCINSTILQEGFCENNDMNKIYYTCPNGCSKGVCKKKSTGKHLLVADDKAPSSDVIILTEVGLFLKQNNYGVESTKLNSEVTKGMLDYIVTTFVYEGGVVIIVGSNSPSSHNTLAQEIKDFLEDEKGIRAKIKSSSKVKSDDLRELFPEYVSEPEVEEPEEETLTPPPIIPEEQDECTSKKDCNDNNACTTDTCSGTPKKCLNIETMSGCNYNKNCIPIGVRVFNEYCDIDKEVYTQKDKEEPCKNNYECSSNLCINDKCVSPSLIQKIMNWFKGIVGQAIGIFY